MRSSIVSVYVYCILYIWVCIYIFTIGIYTLKIFSSSGRRIGFSEMGKDTGKNANGQHPRDSITVLTPTRRIISVLLLKMTSFNQRPFPILSYPLNVFIYINRHIEMFLETEKNILDFHVSKRTYFYFSK